MLNFRPFFDFSQICQNLCMCTAIRLKNSVQYFFFRQFVFRIREITCAIKCVFHCVDKEIDSAFSPGANYSFSESGLQITLRLLSSSSGNIVLLHALFLEYETQISEKKKNTGQCFSIELQFTCITADKSEKNRKAA